jgi:predicted nucleotidyltransferase
MNVSAVLETVRGFLDRDGIPFAVVGALALHAYGFSRSTNDVDLLVGSAAQDTLVGFLEKNGFETLHRSSGFSNHLHPDRSIGRLDVIYVDDKTQQMILAGARKSTIAGVTVAVPKPEHLVAMKVHAMKNDPQRTFQDMADIRYLAGLPGVDVHEIRRYFEDAGLMERFHEIERSL